MSSDIVNDTVIRVGGGGSDSGGGNIDCSVTYHQVSPCSGDCWSAYATYAGTVVQQPEGDGAPCPPLVISISCAGSMPCECRGADLPIAPRNSLTTCNDCSYLAPGETCFLACAEPHLQMSGTPEITCANGVWALAGLPPSCSPQLAMCPSVMNVNTGSCSNNGVLVQPGSTCVGAVEGDVCNISCAAGFSIVDGGVVSAVCHDGVWCDKESLQPTQLACASQAGCVSGTGSYTGDTCAGNAGCPSTRAIPIDGYGSFSPGALLHLQS